MTPRSLSTDETISREPSTITDEKLIYLGGLLGLAPSIRGGNGQRLAVAAVALQPEAPGPDFEADAEFVERELFVPEDRA